MESVYVLIVFVFVLASTVSVHMYRKAYPKTRNANEIEVYSEPPEQEYVEIGEVVHVQWTTDPLRYFKKAAAKMGADAVILDKSGASAAVYEVSLVGPEKKKAIAIKFVKK